LLYLSVEVVYREHGSIFYHRDMEELELHKESRILSLTMSFRFKSFFVSWFWS
jgi:hypothetical protein